MESTIVKFSKESYSEAIQINQLGEYLLSQNIFTETYFRNAVKSQILDSSWLYLVCIASVSKNTSRPLGIL